MLLTATSRSVQQQTLSDTVPTADLFEKIPDQVNRLFLEYSTPADLENLLSVSKHFFDLCQHNVLWLRFLKPEIRQGISSHGKKTARQLFLTPSNRLDEYVPVDARGKHYLKVLNPQVEVTDNVIELLTTGKLSVKQFSKISALLAELFNFAGVPTSINQQSMEEFQRLESECTDTEVSYNFLQQRIKEIEELLVDNAIAMQNIA